MANTQSSTFMSASMNMAITIFGFVLSALFMLVICCRLLCSRVRQANTLEMLQSGRRGLRSSSVDRSLQGLEPSVVASFPTVKYNLQIFTSMEDNLCTICLGDYKEKEVLRVLPRCGHAFHVACVDVWLRQHSTCPVCRISLRIFSEWRRMSGRLISYSARSRFVPGALPDSLFEQPSEFQSASVGMPIVLSNESLGYPLCSGPAVVGDKAGMEMAESSISRRLEKLELSQDAAVAGSIEKALGPKLKIVSDPLSNNEIAITAANMPDKDRVVTLLWDSSMTDAGKEERSTSTQCDASIFIHEVVEMQEEGPSFDQTALDGKGAKIFQGV